MYLDFLCTEQLINEAESTQRLRDMAPRIAKSAEIGDLSEAELKVLREVFRNRLNRLKREENEQG